jgi:uncharacterized membrane protein
VGSPTVGRPGWGLLAALLGTSGLLHFVTPRPFERIVPRQLGDPSPWVAGSGAAELVCAAGLVHPRTRPHAALGAAALLAAVFPANVQMALTAVRSPKASPVYLLAMVARLPVQVPLVAWALAIRRRSR